MRSFTLRRAYQDVGDFLDAALPYIGLIAIMIALALVALILVVSLNASHEIATVLRSNHLNAVHTAYSTHQNSILLRHNDAELQAQNSLLRKILEYLER